MSHQAYSTQRCSVALCLYAWLLQCVSLLENVSSPVVHGEREPSHGQHGTTEAQAEPQSTLLFSAVLNTQHWQRLRHWLKVINYMYYCCCFFKEDESINKVWERLIFCMGIYTKIGLEVPWLLWWELLRGQEDKVLLVLVMGIKWRSCPGPHTHNNTEDINWKFKFKLCPKATISCFPDIVTWVVKYWHDLNRLAKHKHELQEFSRRRIFVRNCMFH